MVFGGGEVWLSVELFGSVEASLSESYSVLGGSVGLGAGGGGGDGGVHVGLDRDLPRRGGGFDMVLPSPVSSLEYREPCLRMEMSWVFDMA